MRHNTMKTIGMVISVIVSLMIGGSGIAMLAGVKKVADGLIEVGVGNYLILLGVMHIAFVLLFLYPKTFKLGFLLLCCYFGGAMATELSHGKAVGGAFPLVLIWIAAFLRDRTIFINK